MNLRIIGVGAGGVAIAGVGAWCVPVGGVGVINRIGGPPAAKTDSVRIHARDFHVVRTLFRIFSPYYL